MNINIKTLIKSASLLVALLVVQACVEPDDLITDGAKEGGLVSPADTDLSFVSGSEVELAVALTEGITEVNFYKSYFADGEQSNEVLDKTIAASGDEVSYTSNYASLKNGLEGMPNNDTELAVGDYWKFRIVSKLADGRLVESAIPIKVTVDNPYSGDYHSVGTIKRETAPGVFATNDYEDDKPLFTIGSATCQTYGAYGWFANPTILFYLTVNGDNTVTIEADPTSAVVIAPTPAKVSTYDPVAKSFHLYYEYTNASNLRRVMDEVVTRVP